MSTADAALLHLQRLASQTPRVKKQRFLAQLTEDDFRDRVVRPLFLMQEYQDGRETCGVSEHGSDSYFTKTSTLGGTDVYVVQTKRGKITLASVSKDNLANLAAQLRTALEHPIALIAEKRKVQPIQAFLVASGEINDAARNHIVDALPTPSLKFLDVEQIIPLIDKHLPQIWLDIESDTIPYFRDLCTAIESGTLVSGVFQVEGGRAGSAALDDTYGQIQVIRPRRTSELSSMRKKKGGGGVQFHTLPFTSLTNERERLLVVLGDEGSGKSTALTRLAYELARRPIDTVAELRIPIFLRARNFAIAVKRPLVEYMIDRVQSINPTLKAPFSENDLTNGRVVVLVDGLDEIADDALAEQVISTLLDFNVSYGKCQVIMTSRNTTFTRSSTTIKRFTEYTVAPFMASEARKIVTALANVRKLSDDDKNEILRQLQEIRSLTLSPLIVTLFAMIADGTRRDLPPNITELFKKYTELMLGRWDEVKELRHQTKASVKSLVLQQIALRMHEQKQTSLGVGDFQRQIEEELRSRGFGEDAGTLYREIVDRSGLLKIDAESDRIEFEHLLFQEFFAGLAIPGTQYIDERMHDTWWKMPVVFFFGDHPNDIASLIELAESLSAKPLESAFIAAIVVGLALQACYFAHVDSKRHVFKAVLETILRIRTDPNYNGDSREIPFTMLLIAFFGFRQSLALANLRIFADDLRDDMATEGSKSNEDDEIQFWLIIGLLESGYYELARGYVDRFKPAKPELLLAVLLQLSLELMGMRFLSGPAEKEVRNMIRDVGERLAPLRPILKKIMQDDRNALERLADEPRLKNEKAKTPESLS